MRAVFIGHQWAGEGLSFALFNVDAPGNVLDGSTVSATTIKKLGIRHLYDKEGTRLLTVPLPAKGV